MYGNLRYKGLFKPTQFRLAGSVTAGESQLPCVSDNTAVYVTTGAPIPPGADAVVKVERILVFCVVS